MVKDSTGKIVGNYLLAAYDPFYWENSQNVPGSSPPEFVFIRTQSAGSFAVRLSTGNLGALVDYAVAFTSTDCSGQGYLAPVPIAPGFPPVMPVLSYAAVLGSTAYIGGTAVSGPFVTYSYLHFVAGSVVCSQYSGDFTSQFVPVVATFDLATLSLSPPFSLQ